MLQKQFIFLILTILLFLPDNGKAQSYAKTDEVARVDAKIQIRIKWDGRIIPGITTVSGLKRTTEVICNRSAESASLPRLSPGVTNYQPLVITRSRSYDKEFERWANKVWNLGSGPGTEVSLKDFRKDIIIELCDETGKTLMAFRVYRCWPSEYVALGTINVDDNVVATESLILQHEGWERDYDIQ